MEVPEAVVILLPSAEADITQQSSERLLAQLDRAARARHRHRNLLKTTYIGYFVAYFVLIAYAIAQIFSNRADQAMQLIGPTFLTLFAFVPAVYWLNKGFYWRNGKAHARLVTELARRGEERALGPLLDLMDIRLTGSAAIWAQNRSVFVQAMISLLARLTPETFADLNNAQVHQLTPLLMLREPGLKDAVTDMFMRCGDARALRALRGFKKQYQLQKIQKWNPFLIVMMGVMRKSSMAVLDQDSEERLLRCCEAMQPRVDAENRAAQLLRPSEAGEEVNAAQLLRGAMPDNATTASEQLLRPGISPTEAVSVDIPTKSTGYTNSEILEESAVINRG